MIRRQMSSELQVLATFMRAERKRQGLSQKAVASLMGVQQSSISEYEAGITDMSVSSFLRWLEALGLAVEIVIADSDTDKEGEETEE